MLTKLSKVQSTDDVLNRVQDGLIRSLNPVLGNQILQGQLLQSVSLATGLNTINHKLGRDLVGWFITRLRANSIVWDSQDTNQSSNLTLILNASAPVVIDLWVF